MNLLEAYDSFKSRPRYDNKEAVNSFFGMTYPQLMTASVLMPGMLDACETDADLDDAVRHSDELIKQGKVDFYERGQPCLHRVFSETMSLGRKGSGSLTSEGKTPLEVFIATGAIQVKRPAPVVEDLTKEEMIAYVHWLRTEGNLLKSERERLEAEIERLKG